MEHTFRLIAALPDNMKFNRHPGVIPGYMSYKIGDDFHLYRSRVASMLRGGIMIIEDCHYSGQGKTGPLLSEIISECAVNGFAGIVLDFSQVYPSLVLLTRQLNTLAVRNGLELYVNEAYAEYCKNGSVILSTALSGGTLFGYLKDAAVKYGPDHIAVNREFAMADFTLPSKDGCGRDITKQELEKLSGLFPCKHFFSPELCLYYFTFNGTADNFSTNATSSTKAGNTIIGSTVTGDTPASNNNQCRHFILYDTSASIKRKISIASSLGISTGFINYAQAASHLDSITGLS